ncbi:hypothetical protein NEDG_01983 [Nematocida displodere]|uniref:Uncharacterized protein n=1 Tax=Nematocida displodere TaxID=1805483 RepID=A0A177EG20_9MICR|nr:hypothetical protein NEDG_01983 [Nematocida displodere]
MARRESSSRCISLLLENKETGVVGGFSRTECVSRVCTFLLERFQHRGRPQLPEKEKRAEPGERKKLSSFENRTDTTSLTKCSVLVIAPNLGLISEVVKRLLNEPGSRLGESSSFYGSEDDNFLIGLKYVDATGFEEASNFTSDLIITTTKHLIELGDHKIDRSQYLVKTEEELAHFDRTAKMALGIYSFLSGIDTTIYLDADLLQMQNMKSVAEVLSIVKESQPRAPKTMNLKYLSSGEEKKAFLLLADTASSEMVALVREEDSSAQIVIKQSTGPVSKKGPKNPAIFATVFNNPNMSVISLCEHHLAVLSQETDRFVVLLRDILQVEQLKAYVEGSNLLGANGIFFIDEHTPKNKIKEELKLKNKRIWVVTERFVFFRKTRLPTLLLPFQAQKILSPNIPNRYILSLLKNNTGIEDAGDLHDPSPYSSPIILISSKHDEFSIEKLINREFVPQDEFMFEDWIRLELAID